MNTVQEIMEDFGDRVENVIAVKGETYGHALSYLSHVHALRNAMFMLAEIIDENTDIDVEPVIDAMDKIVAMQMHHVMSKCLNMTREQAVECVDLSHTIIHDTQNKLSEAVDD